MTNDTAKLRSAMHYVIYKGAGKNIGHTKLNKILFCADVNACDFGPESLTGATYVRAENGPIIKNYGSILRDLQAMKLIAGPLKIAGLFLYVSLKEPDMSAFTDNEISSLDKIINEIAQNYTVDAICKETHNIIWDVYENGEVLPISGYFRTHLIETTVEQATAMARRAKALEDAEV